MTILVERMPSQVPDLYEMILSLVANTTSVILGTDENGAYIHSTLAELAPLRLVDRSGGEKDGLSLSLLAQLYLRNDADSLRVLLVDPRRRLSSVFHAFPQTRLVAASPTSRAHALYTLHQELTRRRQSTIGAPPWLVFVEEDRSLRQDEQTWQFYRALIAQGREVGLFVVVASSLADSPGLEEDPLSTFRSTATFSRDRREATRMDVTHAALPDLAPDKICEPGQPTRFVFEQDLEVGRTVRKVSPPFVDTRLLFLLAAGWSG